MAQLAELSLTNRLFVKAYRWRAVDPLPWTPLAKPLADSRLAIISTAGLVLPSQEGFDGTVRGGDWSYRVIPDGSDVRSLIDTHRSESYDHGAVRADPNVAFPLDRLTELVAAGRIGAAAPRHLSFMGSITAPGRLIAQSAPEAADVLVEDGVDVALLVPV